MLRRRQSRSVGGALSPKRKAGRRAGMRAPYSARAVDFLPRVLPTFGLAAGAVLWGLRIPEFWYAPTAAVSLALLLALAGRASHSTVVGLDIGHSSIKVAEVTRKGKPTLVRYGIFRTPAGTVADGVIRDEERLSEAIAEALGEAKVAEREVVTVMTGQTLVLQHLDFPRMRDGDLRTIIDQQIGQYVPMPSDEISYDYVRIPGGDGDLMRVMLVATQREPLVRLARTLRQAGLLPTKVDIEPLAAQRACESGAAEAAWGGGATARRGSRTRAGEHVARTGAEVGVDAPASGGTPADPGAPDSGDGAAGTGALASAGGAGNEAAVGDVSGHGPPGHGRTTKVTVIADLGAGTSNVSIYQDGVLQLLRVLRVAGNDLTRAIAIGEKVSMEEAEALKREHGLTVDSPISWAMDPTVEQLFREVRLSLEFFHSRNREARFEDLILIGGNAKLKNLPERLQAYLAASLGGVIDTSAMRIGVGGCGGGVGIHPSLSQEKLSEDFPVIAVALGLALGEVSALGGR